MTSIHHRAASSPTCGIQGCLIACIAFAAMSAAPVDKPPVTQPAAPATRLFDDVNRFRRVVFLIDTSASMVNKMAVVRNHFEKALGSLQAEQAFNVIPMHRRDKPFREDLVPASLENKAAGGKFLDGFSGGGTTDPLFSIEMAFHQTPDVIYLLTDGDFPDNDAVLKKCRELNKGKRVKIYTIALVGMRDTDTAFIDCLKAVARVSGGRYKYAKETDLE